MFSSEQADWSPNDWPESLPEMRTIDNLLRCSICFEYFNIAVMIRECSHNYCSLCIRRAITYETHCPTCHVKAAQHDLKCNRVLDELVKNYITVRKKLLQLISQGVKQNTPAQVNATPVSKGKTPSGKQSMAKSKQKSQSRTTPRETPNHKRKRRKILDSDDEEMEVEEIIIVKREPNTVTEGMSAKKKPRQSKEQSDSPPKPPDFAECPVCCELIIHSKMNSHLDVCLMSGDKKEALRSKKEKTNTQEMGDSQLSSKKKQTCLLTDTALNSPPGTSSQENNSATVLGSNTFIPPFQKKKPLPKLVYTLLNDKQLKQKLKESGLSTQGTREKLVKRHKEFVMLYNAQCDSAHPKSAATIIKEMDRNERTQNKLAKPVTTESTLNSRKQSSEEELEAARKQYLKENQGEFERLINEVRSRRNKERDANKSKTESETELSNQKASASKQETLTSDGVPSNTVTENETGNVLMEDMEENNATSKGDNRQEIPSGRSMGNSTQIKVSLESNDLTENMSSSIEHLLEKTEPEHSIDVTDCNVSEVKDTNALCRNNISTCDTSVTNEDACEIDSNVLGFGESIDNMDNPPAVDEPQLTSESTDDEDSELTPSLGLDSSDKECESEDDPYALETSPVINVGSSRREYKD